MTKLTPAAIIFITALTAAFAADAHDYYGGMVAPELSQPKPGHLLNEDYLTPTGETVQRPGVPQSGGSTVFDPARIRQHMNELDNQINDDICSNC
jgi:hypothetical protein